MTWLPLVTLFVMMLALGLTLRVADFARMARRPRALGVGLAGQLVLLPAAAVILALGLKMPPATAVGLLILAACPGGATSNTFSRYAGGDVALSISLTAVSSLLAPLTVPLLLSFGTRLVTGDSAVVAVPAVEMVGGLLATTVLPVLLGMLWLHHGPASAARLRGPLLGLASMVLVLLIVGLGINTFRLHGDVAGLISRSFAGVTALILTTAGAAALACRALGLPPAQGRTLMLEVGVQNVNLALVIAVTHLHETRYLGPALVYLPVMLLLVGIAIVVFRCRDRGR